MESNINIIKKPVIFVIGSTASGKTKLSLELAKNFQNIEIVNADALQLYKGADIMTAKATPEERQLVPHHLLDILPLENMEFQRRDYFNLASKTIEDLHKENKIPLVVGGTNYYIESLLYTDYDLSADNLNIDEMEINNMHEIATKGIESNKSAGEFQDEEALDVPKNYKELTPTEKHELLSKIDPLLAEKVHPNDTKRVENYIKVYVEENIIPSKKIMKVDSQRKLRYENVILFWVKDKEKSSLIERIRKRIVEMVDMNGLKEIIRIYSYLERFGPFDFQKGILQSIGYKEFYEFYKTLKEKGNKENIEEILEDYQSIESLDPTLKGVIEECINKLVGATEAYAKRQVTWIKNRLASQPLLKNRVFLLEFTAAPQFQTEVTEKGVELAKQFFKGQLTPEEDEDLDQEQLLNKYKNWKRFTCDVCQVTINGQSEWDVHLKSKRHKKTKERIAKHQKNMEMKQLHEKKKLEMNDEKNEDENL